jgi:hypothetical protein
MAVNDDPATSSHNIGDGRRYAYQPEGICDIRVDSVPGNDAQQDKRCTYNQQPSAPDVPDGHARNLIEGENDGFLFAPEPSCPAILDQPGAGEPKGGTAPPTCLDQFFTLFEINAGVFSWFGDLVFYLTLPANALSINIPPL